MIRLTERARALLAPEDTDRVLVFGWHAIAVCCAAAGEVTLTCAPRSTVTTARHQQLPAAPAGTVYAARPAYPHLVGRDIVVDARRRFGITSYSSDLPPDFGLRVSFGRDFGREQPLESHAQPSQGVS